MGELAAARLTERANDAKPSPTSLYSATSPKGRGKFHPLTNRLPFAPWLSLWESCHGIAVTERDLPNTLSAQCAHWAPLPKGEASPYGFCLEAGRAAQKTRWGHPTGF